jgi:transposase
VGHRSGQQRQQAALFPLMLDELVEQDSLVRVIDLWVDSLDLVELGFKKAVAHRLGQPPYAPGDLLKLYVWGYACGVRSSRRLEAQCHSDVNCMWLLGRLAPDHKTISNFRRDNALALVGACAGFVQFARTQGLLRGKTVAVDGTKVRAVSSSRWVAGKDKLQQLARQNVEQVQAYLAVLDASDQEEERQSPNCKRDAAQRALKTLQAQGAQLDECLRQVLQERRKAAVTGEPQARPMKSLHGEPGYNVQAAVDTETHLVVHHDVCTDGNDSNQLAPVARGASEAVGAPVTVVADSGYTNGHQLHEVDQQGIEAAVPARHKTNTTGLLEHAAFTYDGERDCFVCPQGKLLQYRNTNHNGMLAYMARAGDCAACPMKAQCTNGKQRYITRHPHQGLMDRAHRRWQGDEALRKQRSSTVEHVWGNVKSQILISGKLVLRGLAGARIEMALAMLAYNLKRLRNLKGSAWMTQALQG